MTVRNFRGFVPVFVITLALAGCSKSDSSTSSDGSGGASSSSAITGENAAARDAVMAEIQKHFTKTADGWVTERISGSAYSPDHFLREFKEITPDAVNAFPLEESDKLNGFEWSGEVTFKKAPLREAGDSGMVADGLGDVSVDRPRGRWSQWVGYSLESVKVQKQKGKWQVDTDTFLLRGQLPTADDFTKAGVK